MLNHLLTVGISGENAGSDSVTLTVYPNQPEVPTNTPNPPGNNNSSSSNSNQGNSSGSGGRSKPSIRPDVTSPVSDVTPTPAASSYFTDVSPDAYYADAVAWAVENGITSGMGRKKFQPDEACTRV